MSALSPTPRRRSGRNGFLVAVDDFGAGHSNLDRLLTLRPDIVKLDRSLIHAHQPDLRESVMPKLVSLLHEAGMLVVAEGIETEEDLLLAARSGVDFVQGFLFGQPGPGYRPKTPRRSRSKLYSIPSPIRARPVSLPSTCC